MAEQSPNSCRSIEVPEDREQSFHGVVWLNDQRLPAAVLELSESRGKQIPFIVEPILPDGTRGRWRMVDEQHLGKWYTHYRTTSSADSVASLDRRSYFTNDEAAQMDLPFGERTLPLSERPMLRLIPAHSRELAQLMVETYA